CPPQELRAMPMACERVKKVKESRLASKSPPTRKLADTPTRFHVENMPKGNYLVIPEVSSERRQFIPIGFEKPETLASNLVKVMPDAELFHFGILNSTMHNAWTRNVCGRMKSDYRYSVGIVYNNFPWPPNITIQQKQAIEEAAEEILRVRSMHKHSSLADLYDPVSMPPDLIKSHRELDRAVDKAYSSSNGKKKWLSDAERVAFLFDLYETISRTA
ncbi:MAG: class I SAM-dependent DNA methyltransferase, partial [Proteobacteria bacterium]